MLRHAKLAALGLARALGANALVLGSSWRRNRLLILCYHGTSLDDEHEWNPTTHVTAEKLRLRLETIQDAGCNVLPLEEGVRRLYEGSLPPRSLAITYDDGTYDFYGVAFPILSSFGFPVTVYLTTYYAQYHRPVYDPMVSYLLWKARGRTLWWPEVWGGDKTVEITDAEIREGAARLRRFAAERGLGGMEKDALLAELAGRLDLDYESIMRRRILHIMTLEESQELAVKGVDFQLHTHRHRVSRDKTLFEREIAENRESLAFVRRSAAVHFCYPSGVHRPEFPGWLREWNMASAVTTETGLASRNSDSMLLPRVLDSNTITEAEFAAWLSGIAGFFPRRKIEEPQGMFLEDWAALREEGIGEAATPARRS